MRRQVHPGMPGPGRGHRHRVRGGQYEDDGWYGEEASRQKIAAGPIPSYIGRTLLACTQIVRLVTA